MKIGCLQFAPVKGDVNNNLSRADSVLVRANPEDLDLLVLPEMAFSGYPFTSVDEIYPHLEPLGSGISSLWARSTALKYGCAVAVGYPEKVVSESGRPPTQLEVFYNSVIVVDGDGDATAAYRKSQLHGTDETWAHEGASGFFNGPMSTAKSTALGVSMDINPYRFQRSLNVHEFAVHVQDTDATLVLVLMAWPTEEDGTSFSQAPQDPDMDTLGYWVSRLDPLIRRDSGEEVIVVFANRTGAEDDFVYAGTSAVIGIKDGEVNVYGLLGRSDRKLLVVDTSKEPCGKLVYRSAAEPTVPTAALNKQQPTMALKSSDYSRDHPGPHVNAGPNIGRSIRPPAFASPPKAAQPRLSLQTDSRVHHLFRGEIIATPSGPSPTPMGLRPRFAVPPTESVTARYIDSQPGFSKSRGVQLGARVGRTLHTDIPGSEQDALSPCPSELESPSTTFSEEICGGESAFSSPGLTPVTDMRSRPSFDDPSRSRPATPEFSLPNSPFGRKAKRYMLNLYLNEVGQDIETPGPRKSRNRSSPRAMSPIDAQMSQQLATTAILDKLGDVAGRAEPTQPTASMRRWASVADLASVDAVAGRARSDHRGWGVDGSNSVDQGSMSRSNSRDNVSRGPSIRRTRTPSPLTAFPVSKMPTPDFNRVRTSSKISTLGKSPSREGEAISPGKPVKRSRSARALKSHHFEVDSRYPVPGRQFDDAGSHIHSQARHNESQHGRSAANTPPPSSVGGSLSRSRPSSRGRGLTNVLYPDRIDRTNPPPLPAQLVKSSVSQDQCHVEPVTAIATRPPMDFPAPSSSKPSISDRITKWNAQTWKPTLTPPSVSASRTPNQARSLGYEVSVTRSNSAHDTPNSALPRPEKQTAMPSSMKQLDTNVVSISNMGGALDCFMKTPSPITSRTGW